MPRNLKVVVFDLDGTLADTANIELLVNNYRSPFDLLSITPAMDEQKRLLFDKSMIWKISYLIQCGIHVYLITKAPKPYASTLSYLLGIDFCGLIPSNSTLATVGQKLAYISKITKSEKSEMLYIGDLEEDEKSAGEFGCFFQFPTWTKEHIGKRDRIEHWFKICGERVNKEGEATGVSKILESKYEERLLLQDALTSRSDQELDFSENLISCNFPVNKLHENVFSKPALPDVLMKPFVNPHLFTRFEYETDQSLRIKLFNLLNFAGLGPQQIKSPSSFMTAKFADVELHCSVGYRSEVLGSSLWQIIKDWKGIGSGPRVHLHFMELVALGMSASLYFRDEFAVIVPVPPTQISSEHPGQISFRLAHRISQLTEIPLLNLMTKDENGLIKANYARYPFSRPVYLIDDQITTGKNAQKCIEALHEIGVTDIKVFTWSSSKFELMPPLGIKK